MCASMMITMPSTACSGSRFTAPVTASRVRMLSTEGWGKGHAWSNGFSLGRFWDRGPQTTLYVPGPVLGTENEVVILCLHGTENTLARFVPQPRRVAPPRTSCAGPPGQLVRTGATRVPHAVRGALCTNQSGCQRQQVRLTSWLPPCIAVTGQRLLPK
ncbi:hypothetical protein [Cryobacterium adonitolivorans]|uniref:hypothetical protein n=1 Tax=Cryobacterium adonitolivorans TaxID=1259189 RepID=UPI0030B9D40F